MRQKFISKIVLALLVMTIAVQTLSTTAFALIGSDIGTITVNKIEKGVTLHCYYLMYENYDYEAQQMASPMYLWADEVYEWVCEHYPEYIDQENGYSVTEAFSNATDAEIAEFYDVLSVAIKKGDVDISAYSMVAEDESAVFEDLETGNYLILIENGVKVYRPLTANVLHLWQDEAWEVVSPVVDAKASAPTITKTVTDGLTKDNVSIGDTISYELVAVVPQYPENAISKKVIVSDKLSEGLTFVEDSVKVYGVNTGEEPVLLSEGYTQTTSRPDGVEGETETTFSLDFDYSILGSYSSVKITYNAILNENAKIGSEGNDNNAYLDYNNNPYVEGTWKGDDTSAKIYTYGMEITKVDEETGAALAGAEFSLSKDGEKIAFVGEAGNYRVARSGETSTQVLSVDENGLLTITGLDAATYSLTEEKAPDEYIKLQKPVEIVIADSDMDGNVESGDEEMESGILPVTVKNNKGFTLPVTGGIGTGLFSTFGILLMGTGIILLIRYKKTNAR